MQDAVPLFLSYRSEARLEPGFRQDGSYVGAGTFGPIEAAAEILTEKQPMFYTNSRGMILSNPGRGYSLAHYRLTQDGQFLLPWWAYSRAESAKDSFYYTPTGWKLPFGISRLKPGGTVAYEENLAVTPGNYHDFVTQDYGVRQDVRRDLARLGPAPAWLANVKVCCTDGGIDGREYDDFNNIRRLAELTDEGEILVLINMAGHNVADYYVDDGLVGLHGGWITGPELREWVRKLKAISPRVKVGIYCYFGAPHITGPNTHTHLYYATPRLFAGFMVDFHTAAGYAKRVALSVGVVHPDCSTPYPSYGKGGKPDQVVDLGPIVAEGPAKEFDLDLSLYAPAGWDGQVWFSVGSDWALPGRRLKARLLAANQPPTAAALRGTDPSLIKKAFLAKAAQLSVPRAGAAVAIDGRLDDPAWAGAASTDDFAIVGGLALPTAKTAARLLYDAQYLYGAMVCEEPKRAKPLAGKGDIWRDDEVEIYLDTDHGRKSYKQVIINAAGDMMELTRPGGQTSLGTRVKTSAEPGKSWTVEAAIPFRTLGKTPAPGQSWGLNLCRFRPEGSGFALECITWAPTENGFGGDEVGKFGSLTFK